MEQGLDGVVLTKPAAASPHILAIPYPAVGHITPLVQLCKALIVQGCRVTVVCTERNRSLLSKLMPEADRPQQQHIRVLTIADGLPSDLGPPSWDLMRTRLATLLGRLPFALAPHIHNFHDVSCVLSDAYLSWTQDVADQLNVPRIALWVSSAAECQVYYHSHELISTGKLPFKEPCSQSSVKRGIDNIVPGFPGRQPIYHRVDEEDNERIDIPGLPNLRRKDFPIFLQIEDPSDELFYIFVDHVKSSWKASMILLNSFEALEGVVLASMRSQGICAHPVGPLLLLKDQVVKERSPSQPNDSNTTAKTNQLQDGETHEKQSETEFIEEELSQVRSECLQWLDGQGPRSVMYVAFGTLVQLPKSQITELALGLNSSGQPFIWVLPNHELPEGILDQVKGKGLVVDWAPQSHILQHPSIGGFLSHCGWNSSMESLCSGVPVLGFPLISDQPLICKMMVEEWKVALRLDRSSDEGNALAVDISRLTREILVGEKGKELRKRAKEWSQLAWKSIQLGGSSRVTLDAIMKLIQ
eukprot:c2849_g1_i1 orf=133-1716(-)